MYWGMLYAERAENFHQRIAVRKRFCEVILVTAETAAK